MSDTATQARPRPRLKAVYNDQIRDQLKASAREENQKLAALVGTAANREALNAFREKRAPDFSKL